MKMVMQHVRPLTSENLEGVWAGALVEPEPVPWRPLQSGSALLTQGPSVIILSPGVIFRPPPLPWVVITPGH